MGLTRTTATATAAVALSLGLSGAGVVASTIDAPAAAAQQDGAPVLQLGDRGPAVTTWQRKLNLLTTAGITPDGVYGAPTEAATANFQRFFGLTVDGIVGPDTRSVMDYLIAVSTPTTTVAEIGTLGPTVVGYPSEAGYCFEVRPRNEPGVAECDPPMDRLTIREIPTDETDIVAGTVPSSVDRVVIETDDGSTFEPGLEPLTGSDNKGFATSMPISDIDAIRAFTGGQETAVLEIEDGQSYLVLDRGDRGDAVAAWQGKLNAVTGADLATDGVFGATTAEATRNFQRFFDLTVDGIVGPATRDVMQYVLGLQTGG